MNRICFLSPDWLEVSPLFPIFTFSPLLSVNMERKGADKTAPCGLDSPQAVGTRTQATHGQEGVATECCLLLGALEHGHRVV